VTATEMVYKCHTSTCWAWRSKF